MLLFIAQPRCFLHWLGWFFWLSLGYSMGVEYISCRPQFFHVAPCWNWCIYSFPWFPAASTTLLIPKNQFFSTKKKFSVPKFKSRQASYCCKMALKSSKLAYYNKTKKFVTYQKLFSGYFWHLLFLLY